MGIPIPTAALGPHYSGVVECPPALRGNCARVGRCAGLTWAEDRKPGRTVTAGRPRCCLLMSQTVLSTGRFRRTQTSRVENALENTLDRTKIHKYILYAILESRAEINVRPYNNKCGDSDAARTQEQQQQGQQPSCR